MRITIIALLVSFLAGGFTALILKGMQWVTDLVWQREIASSPFYILGACVIGGILVGLTRLGSNHVETLDEQIEAASEPLKEQQRTILMTALGGAIAVGTVRVSPPLITPPAWTPLGYISCTESSGASLIAVMWES